MGSERTKSKVADRVYVQTISNKDLQLFLY